MTGTTERMLAEIRGLPPADLRELWQAINHLVTKTNPSQNLPNHPHNGLDVDNLPGLPNDHPYFQALEEIEASRQGHRRRDSPDLR